MVFFNDTATTEIYTLALHDALPIYAPPQRHGRATDARPVLPPLRPRRGHVRVLRQLARAVRRDDPQASGQDRKSTRLNSSHANISYAVFCLKKKNTTGVCRVLWYCP